MVLGILKYKLLSRGLLILKNWDVAVQKKAHEFGENFYTSPRANGAKRRSGRKPGARVTNSALAFTYIRIMRCYIAQWHSGIKSRPIRHFLCHGRW